MGNIIEKAERIHEICEDGGSISDVVAELDEIMVSVKANPLQQTVMRFKDLPTGARFKYPDSDTIWVAIETYRNGLIVEWCGLHPEKRQSHCCFVDEDWTLDSEVVVLY